MKKKLSLLLVFVLLLSVVSTLIACKGGEQLDTDTPVRISVLNGTTGFGIAQLWDAKNQGNLELNYQVKVETDASVINAALINKDIDIAALPTNAASVLYNRTSGGITVLALNTLGVLYVVENGNTVRSLADLSGKTVYCPAQNPEFILRAVCQLAEVDNVTIDTSYAQPAALMSAVVASSEGMIAVLPEPVLSVAMNKNDNLRVVVDITEAWAASGNADSTLTQGCIVVRTEFLEENPALVKQFLKDYKASIEFLNNNAKEAAQMVVELGIYTGAAAVAEQAIPKCNITYMDGEAMKTALFSFLGAMYEVNPQSIGGALPGDDFYYGE